MKKSKKKLFVTILCLCLVACMGGALFLMAASGEQSPAATSEGSEEALITTEMKMETIAKDDIIYFGKYTENNVDYNVPWVALDANGFLLSKHTLGNSVFHEQDGTYIDSTLKTAMDGFYTGDNALFTTGEKVVIKQTTLAGSSMYSGTTDINAYLYPLSYTEVETIGKVSNLLETTSITNTSGDAVWWWMRSSDDDSFAWSAYGVRSYFLDVLSTRIDSNYGVRPAFNMDSTDILFKSAAVNGKSGSDNASSVLKEVSDFNAEDGWKLTLKDSSRDFAVTQLTEDNNLVTITYSGAATGDNEFISAIIIDRDNEIQYYGRIAQPENTSGTATIDLSGIDMTDKMLYVFSEQCNGDKKTDYASALKEVQLSAKVVSYENISAYRAESGYTAPEAPAGYIFAGWYKDKACTKENAVGQDETDVAAYAKFVDARVLTVKAQITAGTTASSDKTSIRFVTAVDGLNYRRVAFLIKIHKDSGIDERDRGDNIVYRELTALVGDEVWKYSPQTLFCNSATYFKAWIINNIPNANFDTKFEVTPYWETLDGTIVYGTTATKTVREGIK